MKLINLAATPVVRWMISQGHNRRNLHQRVEISDGHLGGYGDPRMIGISCLIGCHIQNVVKGCIMQFDLD